MTDLQPPEEAVEKLGEALCESVPADLELRGGTWIEDPLADEWGEWAANALAKILPAIYTDLRERALSDEARKAAYLALDGKQLKWLASAPPDREALAAAAIEAAFDKATKGDGDATD